MEGDVIRRIGNYSERAADPLGRAAREVSAGYVEHKREDQAVSKSLIR